MFSVYGRSWICYRWQTKHYKSVWSESLPQCFHKAQATLSHAATVTLACSDDQMITHNGAKAQPDIGAMKYLVRESEATFMSVFAECNGDAQHIKGIHNLTVTSDFQLRNPLECNFQDCKSCKFVAESESSVQYW